LKILNFNYKLLVSLWPGWYFSVPPNSDGNIKDTYT